MKQPLDTLGGDATAQTPCADIEGVSSYGILQAISDPRSTLSQALTGLLNAGLIDNAAWELLIQIAQQIHLDKHLVSGFERALQQEHEHLSSIKNHLKWMTLTQASLF